MAIIGHYLHSKWVVLFDFTFVQTITPKSINSLPEMLLDGSLKC